MDDDTINYQTDDEERFFFDHLIQYRELNRLLGGPESKVLALAEKTGLKDQYLTYLRNHG